APIDERQRARASPPLLVGGGLVDVERDGVERDAVVLERPARGDEAPRHVLAHALGVAREGIAPAPAATGLESQQIAALEDEAVAEGGQLALAGRAGVQDDAARAAGMTAGHAVGRDERV